MNEKSIDLMTKVCPYVVMHVIREVGKIRKHETRSFLVADPLAIKSIPEELEEYDDLTISIHKEQNGWEILISRR